jgi:hypothetical protein
MSNRQAAKEAWLGSRAESNTPQLQNAALVAAKEAWLGSHAERNQIIKVQFRTLAAKEARLGSHVEHAAVATTHKSDRCKRSRARRPC